MKKSLIAAALVVSLSAVAVACNNDEATPEPAEATPVVTEAPEATEAPAEEVTEAPAEEVTEAPAEETEATEAPAEEVTEAPAEASPEA